MRRLERVHDSRKRARLTGRQFAFRRICPFATSALRSSLIPSDRRYRYPYINCTNCGPRYSVILALPYDRPNTTMRDWPMDRYCSDEYHDPRIADSMRNLLPVPAVVRDILSAKGQ